MCRLLFDARVSNALNAVTMLTALQVECSYRTGNATHLYSRIQHTTTHTHGIQVIIMKPFNMFPRRKNNNCGKHFQAISSNPFPAKDVAVLELVGSGNSFEGRFIRTRNIDLEDHERMHAQWVLKEFKQGVTRRPQRTWTA